MSNSFSISADVELAALAAAVGVNEGKIDDNKVVIDAIKNETGPIRNDVTSIHDLMLPSIKTDTSAIRNDVTAIHDVNLPDVKTDTGAIRNDVTDIHDVYLPDVKTVVDAIRATDITTITDAITAKLFRGQLKYAYKTHNTGTYSAALNISGKSGVILMIVGETGVGSPMKLKMTADGLASADSNMAAEMTQFITGLTTVNANFILGVSDTPGMLNIEFKDTMLIEIKMTAGAAPVKCGIYYIED